MGERFAGYDAGVAPTRSVVVVAMAAAPVAALVACALLGLFVFSGAGYLLGVLVAPAFAGFYASHQGCSRFASAGMAILSVLMTFVIGTLLAISLVLLFFDGLD